MILIKKRRKGRAPGLKSLKENLEHRPRKILRLRKKVDSVLASVKKKNQFQKKRKPLQTRQSLRKRANAA